MLVIIDYGIGNLRSVQKAIEAVGGIAVRSGDPDVIARADKLLLPGVGAFGACVNELRDRGLDRPVVEAAERGTPLLGVCVGLQLLFDASEELGEHRGLGLLPGRIVRFTSSMKDETGRPLKVPHMGWNRIERTTESPLLDGIPPGSYFYFVHSYFAAPSDEGDVVATTCYGRSFPAVVARNKVYGVQFHPEKSQQNGLRILRNFVSRI